LEILGNPRKSQEILGNARKSPEIPGDPGTPRKSGKPRTN